MKSPIQAPSNIPEIEENTVYDKLRLERRNELSPHAAHDHHHHDHNPLKMFSKFSNFFKKKDTGHGEPKAPDSLESHTHSDYEAYKPPHYTEWSIEADPPKMQPLPKKQGLFARLFAHDHSKGSQGALVVEGVDEGVHPFSNAAATAHLAASPHPLAHTSAFTHLKDIGSAPFHSVVSGVSIGVQSAIAPIGAYTIAISAHEMHEEKHAEKDAAKQAEKFKECAQEYKLLKIPSSMETEGILGAVASAYDGLHQHILHTQQQAKSRFRFWGSSLTSGAAATANSATIIGTTVAGTAVGAAVGGTAALSLPLVGGVATTALGHYHTKGARKDRDYLWTVAPVVFDALIEFEAQAEIKNNPATPPYAYFLREKFPQRDNANKRDVRWGKVFTGGAAAGTAGALTGGLIGFGVGLAAAPPTFGGSVPVCAAIGAAIGGAGGLVAAGSAPILPIRHTKSSRHDRCAKLDPAQPEEVQEAVFRAAADVLEPEASFLLRAGEFNDIGLKNSRSQRMLKRIAANPAIRKSYKPEIHKSDMPSYSPSSEQATKLQRKLRESDIRRFVRDHKNLSAICEYMRDQVAVETQPGSSLQTKVQLQRDIFRKLSDNVEVVNLVRRDFQGMIQRDDGALSTAKNLRNGFDKLLTPGQAISEEWGHYAMGIFLLHNGIQTHDVYEGMAKHLHESGKQNREARERLFHAEWRSGLMRLDQQEEEIPAHGPASKAKAKTAKAKAKTALENAREANRRVRRKLVPDRTPDIVVTSVERGNEPSTSRGGGINRSFKPVDSMGGVSRRSSSASILEAPEAFPGTRSPHGSSANQSPSVSQSPTPAALQTSSSQVPRARLPDPSSRTVIKSLSQGAPSRPRTTLTPLATNNPPGENAQSPPRSQPDSSRPHSSRSSSVDLQKLQEMLDKMRGGTMEHTLSPAPPLYPPVSPSAQVQEGSSRLAPALRITEGTDLVRPSDNGELGILSRLNMDSKEVASGVPTGGIEPPSGSRFPARTEAGLRSGELPDDDLLEMPIEPLSNFPESSRNFYSRLNDYMDEIDTLRASRRQASPKKNGSAESISCSESSHYYSFSNSDSSRGNYEAWKKTSQNTRVSKSGKSERDSQGR